MILLGSVLLMVTCALLINRSWLYRTVHNGLAARLSCTPVFQSYWRAGLLLFGCNALLFGITLASLYVQTILATAFLLVPILCTAIGGSLYLWAVFSRSWKGSYKDRLKLAGIGSSFYGLLALVLLYRLIDMPSLDFDGDPFMASMGLMLGTVVCVTAFASCMLVSGSGSRHEAC